MNKFRDVISADNERALSQMAYDANLNQIEIRGVVRGTHTKGRTLTIQTTEGGWKKMSATPKVVRQARSHFHMPVVLTQNGNIIIGIEPMPLVRT